MSKTRETRETRETQESIAQWADETFGHAGLKPAVRRAIMEATELLELVSERRAVTDITAEWVQRVAAEMADVQICLYRAARIMGVDLHEEVDKKMAINRSRQWVRHGDGTGSHVK